MEATDLMIGDWVQSFGEPHKIIGIKTDTPYPYIKTNMSDTWYEWGMKDLADGIPLTPEILEKNGFVKEEFKESPYVDWYKLVYSAYPNKETELVEVNIVKENNEIVGIACAKMMHTNQRLFRIEKYREMNIYVHELQHALRLCGIEKEIEL